MIYVMPPTMTYVMPPTMPPTVPFNGTIYPAQTCPSPSARLYAIRVQYILIQK